MLISGMYIELFLLENLVMDLLMLRLAAALRTTVLPVYRAIAAAVLGTVYAWLCTRYAWLYEPEFKLAAAMLMALALKNRGGWAGYIKHLLSLLLSACITGGAALALMYVSGRRGFRLGLISACAAALLPGLVRRLLAGRIRARVTLHIVFEGKEYVLPAITDSGNLLMDPLSGRQAAVAYIPELMPKAHIPIPVRTAAGCETLYALKPKAMWTQKKELDMLLALSKQPIECALIPCGTVEEEECSKSFTD